MQINKHLASEIGTGGGGGDWLWAAKRGEAAVRGRRLFNSRRPVVWWWEAARGGAAAFGGDVESGRVGDETG
jgi:hypothetical protein